MSFFFPDCLNVLIYEFYITDHIPLDIKKYCFIPLADSPHKVLIIAVTADKVFVIPAKDPARLPGGEFPA
jgi:hypothetical protein